MHSMAFSSGYRKCAAECAKLACDAPSLKARDSFSAAAKSWLILATLAEGSMVSEQYQIRDRALGRFCRRDYGKRANGNADDLGLTTGGVARGQ
jgi:hypothetical protein